MTSEPAVCETACVHYCAYTIKGDHLSDIQETPSSNAVSGASNDTSTTVAFVAEVGRLVRRGRARRGITRRQLASDSGISVRYLAQIEGGYGNPSLIVLKSIADALEAPLTAFIPHDDRHERLNRIVDLVNRLSPTEWPSLEQSIEARVVEGAQSERAHRIGLVGLRGAGKSTLGRMLAERLGYPFIELNRMVEQEYGASISMLIEMSGVSSFRRYERASLEKVIADHDRVVIATAGGIVSSSGNLRSAVAANAYGMGQGAAAGPHESRDGAGRFSSHVGEPRSDGRSRGHTRCTLAGLCAGRIGARHCGPDRRAKRGRLVQTCGGVDEMTAKMAAKITVLADQGMLDLGDEKLEYRMIGPRPDAAPTIVMLHEGLGCVGMWGDFPDKVAAATGCGVFVYSRKGYGKSSAVPLPRQISYMHEEAEKSVPRVLDAIGFQRGILLGHSDGASIAAIMPHPGPSGARARADGAALHRRGSGREIHRRRARGVQQWRPARAARQYHPNVDVAFRGWNDVWLDNDFRQWDISEELAYIRVPILIVQGEDDQYGTLRQIEIANEECYCPVEVALLPGEASAASRRHRGYVEAGYRFHHRILHGQEAEAFPTV